ncbi:hypothetical protein HKX48_000329 [Thoreauomyces humboldtii]|nr:hypothetical protein HKX48_000329 [Thoreauomyces humboldtii]
MGSTCSFLFSTSREPAAASPPTSGLHGPTKAIYSRRVHHLFEGRAVVHPGRPAVQDGDRFLTYRQLNDKATQLAARLLPAHLIGHRIAIVMQRGLLFPVAALAVLKARASFVPAVIGLSSDADLLNELARVSNASVYFVDQVADTLQSLSPIHSSRPVVPDDSSSDAEFAVLFTSGSTGRPKGVVLHHRGILNIIQNHSPDIGHLEGARVMQFMAIGFDACVWEVWGSLSHGCTLVMRQEDEDVFITLRQVDAVMTTPTGLGRFGRPGDFPNLRHVTVAGEPCPEAVKNMWAGRTIMHNVYGPTETSIISHMGRLRVEKNVTVGTPVHNSVCYVLDENRQPCPAGQQGELYIGGVGVSPRGGYLNIPELTAERFINDPQLHNGVLFKTGDLGRILTDGTFQVSGRKDNQVKLKGYRIELDEVATALESHELVDAAIAVLNSDRLVTFYRSITPVHANDLVAFLSARLPAYMVPQLFEHISEFPLTANGKVDRRQLEVIPLVIETKGAAFGRGGPNEDAMAVVWARVLGVLESSIGSQTSFFSIGGDSISAVRVVSQCRESGMLIRTMDLFTSPVLGDLVRSIRTRTDQVGSSRSGCPIDFDVVKAEVESQNSGTPQKGRARGVVWLYPYHGFL